MDPLKKMKRQLTMADAERAMLIRRDQSTAEIDATIVQIKAEINSAGATVAQVNAAGRFMSDEQSVTVGQLAQRDVDVLRYADEMARRSGPWSEIKFLCT